MRWHVEAKTLEAYALGVMNDAHAYSVEAHLLRCGVCRAAVGNLVDKERLHAVWAQIDDLAAGPHAGPVERLLVRLGVKDHVARLLAATPALRLSWFAALTLALAFAVLAARATDQGFLMFLIVAPMLPLAGVAVSYGPGVDPTYEIGLAAPMRSFHLLLIRACAVLVSTCTLAAIAALALPQLNWTVVAWLLPSLGLTAASLALATMLHPLRAAVAVAIAWIGLTALGAMSAANSSATLEDVFGGIVQVVLLVVTLTSIALLYTRRDRFERGVGR